MYLRRSLIKDVLAITNVNEQITERFPGLYNILLYLDNLGFRRYQ